MNPFLVNYSLPLIKITKEITFTNPEPTGYIGEYVKKTETKSYYIEAQKHTCVYETTGQLELFVKLKPNAIILLSYIERAIDYNKDQIHLNYEKVNKYLNISRPTLISAIKQLIHEGIICKSDKQGMYWINPYFIFKGNRTAYYEEQCPKCIKVVKEIIK